MGRRRAVLQQAVEEEGLDPCYDEETGECNFAANGYRLPTEAEWEYACRAGTTGDYSFGPDNRQLSQYAWFADNANKQTHPVGQKKPNAWGLYDMYGNVAEWCNDVYEKGYYKDGPRATPAAPQDGPRRVLRGGAWNTRADDCRSASRVGESPGSKDACFARDTIGFRCVRRARTAENESLAMVFHTWPFFIFLAVVLPVFFLLRKTRFWIAWLMLASYFFYGWWNPYYLSLVFYSTVLDYFLVTLMDHCPRRGERRRAGPADPAAF